MDDPVVFDDWHPAAASASVAKGTLTTARLLDQELVLWRASDEQVHAWQDRCPHRGTRLSIGSIENDHLICAYHGWRFAASGHCTHYPALPALKPPASTCARTYIAAEHYGLIWVCIGTPRHDVPPFPEYGDAKLRKVLCGPYAVAASAPRIVENFLDMAHFPFVHGGILGEQPRNEVCDYQVGPFDDGAGGSGVIATACFFWQPRPNSQARGGALVEYTYRVVRPFTAILTKVPEQAGGATEAISLHVQPVAEEASVVWIVLAMPNFEQSERELREFQDSIFLQDKPIVENQMPRRLPLAPGAEVSIRSDRMSLAYRAYLREQGLRYGIT